MITTCCACLAKMTARGSHGFMVVPLWSGRFRLPIPEAADGLSAACRRDCYRRLFADKSGRATRSLHYDLRRHPGMDGAEICVRPSLSEGEGEFFIGIERARLEGRLVVANHCVRDIVMIHPGHLGSRGDGQCCRRKAEVVDGD